MNRIYRIPLSVQLCLLITLTSCLAVSISAEVKTMGEVIVNDPALNELIEPGTPIEVLAEGFNWSEGPVWIADGGYVVFSDVPENRIYKWSENEGLSVFLEPSGYTGLPRKNYRQGSNGMALDENGKLLICEHGDRRISRLDIKEGKRRVVVDNYNGARFNSPNDIVVAKNGDFYFTDPCFGLQGKTEDPYREMDYMGVFLVRKNGEVVLVEDSLEVPNGISLSPDGKTLYVSSREKWYRYDIKKDGTLKNRKLIFDAKPLTDAGHKGPTDGISIDAKGNLWAAAPGGILVLSPEGKLLGRVDTGRSTANSCFGGDGSTLYITSDYYLCRIQTKTSGIEF